MNLIIGDDWLTKTMLVQTFSRNEKMRSQAGTLDSGQLFASVLSQLLAQQGSQAPVLPIATNIIPKASGIESWRENLNEPMRVKAINPEQLNKVLAGRLSGMGEVFVEAGEKYNIDPALLASIAQHETGNGKSRAAWVKNNIAGMMGSNGLKQYASVEESIMDMARNLSKNYISKGLTTISTIAAKYAPIGAQNDPTGLNNHWVAGVTRFFNQLQG